jgi:peptidoglycan/LPS O-acetylase OafA/YrhL
VEAIRGNMSTQKHIPGLDGIRAISALMVAAMHFGIMPTGWVGVQFFYVLSGFLITRILFVSRENSNGFGSYVRGFYYRRSLRIFPLYFLYLAFVVVVALFVPSLHGDLRLMPWLLTYTYNVQRAMVFSAHTHSLALHMWSLSVEEQFYILWPLVIFFTPEKLLRKTALATVFFAFLLRLVFGLVLAGGLHANAAGKEWIYFLTPFQMDGFAIGGFLSLLSEMELRRLRRPLLLFTLAAVCGCLLANRRFDYFGLFAPPALHGEWFWLYTLIDLVGAVLVMECLVGVRLARLLEWAPLRYLGRISYGFYVWHFAVLIAVFAIWPTYDGNFGFRWKLAGPFALYVMAVTVIASASFYGFERFFLRYKHRGNAKLNAAEVVPTLP